MAVLTALLFGLAPALVVTRQEVNSALKATALVRPRLSLARPLVVAQVALSLLLLTGAGLFVQTLRNLRTLDLGHNHLEDLPEALGGLTGLTDYLYLHDNQLAAFRPSLFARLTRLKYLNVGDNRLTSLPDTIGDLASLEELRADGNRLESLPSSSRRARAASSRSRATTTLRCGNARRPTPSVQATSARSSSG